MSEEKFYTFLPDGVTFRSRQAADLKMMYAPLCGVDASSLKSAISPILSGDVKIDKFHYVTKPASREDLRYPVRDFFVNVKAEGVFSIGRSSAPLSSEVQVGQIWHQVTRTHKDAGIEITAVNFIPSSNETLELMKITIKNISNQPVTFTPTAAIPIFGRCLANKHDHEHVTALLNRIEQKPEGVLVSPTMAFNEEGHKELHSVYFVFGKDDKAENPVGTFPTTDAFFGDGGNMDEPEAVFEHLKPVRLAQDAMQGKEAVGALQFAEATLKPKAEKSYIIGLGIAPNDKNALEIFSRFDAPSKFDKALDDNKAFWNAKIASIQLKTADDNFDAWMRWVTLQPVLRRIFGCSFLPDHDYGKGGKGWRDLWQDLLSLILIEPHLVKDALINNCGGIRIDGSNATIIGTKPGEFIADRNAITRVWMDHGCWPFLTLQLYINQTGDFDILLHKQSYFRDPQMSRSMEKDIGWMASYGNKLLDKKGHAYEGTILEHVLVQHLTQFFNVGEHNIIRLESADWNDGLDMAFAKGESVAFSSFYAGNLLKIADTVEELGRQKKLSHLRVAKELLTLLDTLSDKPVNYDHASDKRAHLFGKYFTSVQPALSGEQVEVAISDLASDLRKKGNWIFGHIRSCEKVTVGKNTWFNGYYDNQAKRVEGEINGKVRMTLTGQVFAIMSGMADQNESRQVINSVEKFLRDKNLGGYRLNSDFEVRHYLDLGRAFGFAYGTKENGAFFSHMTVMYAYALYARGFAREGYEVINSIYKMATDTAKSKIYPGIPEYFDSEGRGMYHYLTGSASWLVLTVLTQSFGVRGRAGNLVFAPGLVKEQFDKQGLAVVSCQFAGHPIEVQYVNSNKLDAGQYSIKEIHINSKTVAFETKDKEAIVPRFAIKGPSTIKVVLL
jgi:cellobiose phosphorylase